MRGLIVRWVLNALALIITSAILPGMLIKGIIAALFAALFLGIVNAVIRPVILFFTLPLNLITLGLFTFVVNALMLLITAQAINGFEVNGFFTALVGSILLSLISGFFSLLVED